VSSGQVVAAKLTLHPLQSNHMIFTAPHPRKPQRMGQQNYMGMGQNHVALVNIKIAGKWMFIPLKMVSIGIDP